MYIQVLPEKVWLNVWLTLDTPCTSEGTSGSGFHISLYFSSTYSFFARTNMTHHFQMRNSFKAESSQEKLLPWPEQPRSQEKSGPCLWFRSSTPELGASSYRFCHWGISGIETLCRTLTFSNWRHTSHDFYLLFLFRPIPSERCSKPFCEFVIIPRDFRGAFAVLPRPHV